MGADHSRANAEALERALVARRRELGRIDKDEERTRRTQALEMIEQYTLLLRESTPSSSPTGAGASTRSSSPTPRAEVTSSRSTVSATGGSRARSGSV